MTRRKAIAAVALAASAAAVAAWLWSLSEYLHRARRETTKENIRAIDQAIISFRLKNGRLPRDLQELCGEPPTDGWGNAFVYRLTPDGRHDLVSYGADGAPGGENADRDIDLAEVRGK